MTAKGRGTRRKLGIYSALPPVLGGKRKLVSVIGREINALIPRANWHRLTALDGFLGGGSVGLYFKSQGFGRIIATDIAERAIVVGKALIENSRVKLTREDVLRLAASHHGAPGPIQENYSPNVFTLDQARFLDRALHIASRTEDPAKAALYRLLAIRVALLAHAMSQVRPGTIHRVTTGEYEAITESCVHHYVNGLRLTRPEKLWHLAQQINGGVFAGQGSVMKRSIVDALPDIHADIGYFDPPYCSGDRSVMSYEKQYRIIDEILEGHSRPTSPFTAKSGPELLDTLFQRAVHIPVWILSYGDAGVGISELEAKMAMLGRRTRALEIKYKHLPAVATDEHKASNREFLVIGWDPESELLKNVNERRPALADATH